jgi:hypothetical protein
LKSSAKLRKKKADSAVLLRGSNEEFDPIREYCKQKGLILYKFIKDAALEKVQREAQ